MFLKNLTGDLSSSWPFSFHSPAMSSSDISVSKLASSFSTTSKLERGFRISASRSETTHRRSKQKTLDILPYNPHTILLMAQTSECELGSVSTILHRKGVVRHIVGLAAVDGERHVLTIFGDFHLVRRLELIFSLQPLPVWSVLEQLTSECSLGLWLDMLVSQRLHQPVFDDFCRPKG